MGIGDSMRSLYFLVALLVVNSSCETSLGQHFAEKSLVDELSQEASLAANGNMLGESAAPSDTEMIGGLLKNYDKTNWKNFVSFESHEEMTKDTRHDDPPRFIRHLDTAMVMTTVSNRRDQQDAAWIVRPPLCPPGDASKKCPAKAAAATDCFSL